MRVANHEEHLVNLVPGHEPAAQDAISYFESKGLKLSGDWHEIWGRAQAQSITGGQRSQMDVLQDIHEP